MNESRRNRFGKLLPIAGVVVAVGLVTLLLGYLAYLNFEGLVASLSPPRFPNPASPRVLGEADPDWQLRGLDGAAYRFADFNDRVVFVNLWATWCGPCIHEMPSIARLYESLGERQVAFLIVSDEDAETVGGFVERREYPFPVYVQHSPPPRVFRTPGIPATFIVDRRGRVVFRYIGAADWSTDEARNFLLALAGP